MSLVSPSLWITPVKISASGLMYVTGVTVTGVTFLWITAVKISASGLMYVTGVTFLMDNSSEDRASGLCMSLVLLSLVSPSLW